jgi:hypothetical protein
MRALAAVIYFAAMTFAAPAFSAGDTLPESYRSCLRECVNPCIEGAIKAADEPVRVQACADACRTVCAASGSATIQISPPPPTQPILPTWPSYVHSEGGFLTDILKSTGVINQGLGDALDRLNSEAGKPADQVIPFDRGGSENLPVGIIDTRSAPLVHPGDEAAGYGLYTYVLLRESADRDSQFLKDIVVSAPSASGVLAPLRAHIDLMLIPANPCPAPSAKSATNCHIHLVNSVERDLNANYNYGESNTLLEELCAKPPDKLADFCRNPIGRGPFLFTYARPVSTMNPIPPPFLFFDFTEHDEAAFPDYIGAYEAALKSDDFTDDSKLNTLRLRILDVYNRARAATGPTAEGATKLVHLFYAGGKD